MMNNPLYKVLLIDDERGITQGLMNLIDWSHYHCEIIGRAHNGQTGFEMAMSMEPQVIVTDIRMSRMNGLEMIRLLKNNNHQAKFIILSGFSEFEYAKKGMNLGIKHYLIKPVDERELEQSIADVIDQIRMDAILSSGHREQAAPKDQIAQIKQYITEHYAENITLFSLSELFFLNPNYLSQMFKKKTGQTFVQFLTLIRLEHAMRMLADTDETVQRICLESGYSDIRHFRQLFEKHTKQKPGEFRKQTRNEERV